MSATVRKLIGGVVLAASTAAAACGSSPPAPSRVIRVGDEVFRIRLDTPALEQAARAARAGTGPRIPTGRIVSGTDVNAGWSWHLRDVTFADAAIELCDGRPSMIVPGATLQPGTYEFELLDSSTNATSSRSAGKTAPS